MFANQGPDHDHLVARFQHRQPRLGRVDRDAQVARQIAEVQKLSAARREGTQEALELRKPVNRYWPGIWRLASTR